MTHRLRTSCRLSFTVAVPTPMTLMLRLRRHPDQWVEEETFDLAPRVAVSELMDSFGNPMQRLVAPVGDFVVSTSAQVVVAEPPLGTPAAGFVEVPELPGAVLPYLLPSRYCESDRFGNMATDIVADAPAGFAQVAAITNWVHDNVRNVPLSSTYPVSAVEVNERREGVCRDLAQISIALCRSLCIPARLVVGYLHKLKPQDLHAWFEAYVGSRWYAFDPTNPDDREPRITLAHGRDSADVAVYNQYGPLLLPDDMQVTVTALAPA
ncbi:MAG: transglutaminase family protein [Pseudomonadota bacterium]